MLQALIYLIQLVKKDFFGLKAELDKLDIAKLVNVPTSFNNSETKVDDLDVGKLKTVPIDLKTSDAVDNEVVKNTLFSTIKTKISNLDNLLCLIVGRGVE